MGMKRDDIARLGPGARLQIEVAMAPKPKVQLYAQSVELKPKRKSKYGNRRVMVDDFWFDSVAEARRYRQLRTLEAAGEIRDLQLQPAYPIIIGGTKICTYRGDFQYVTGAGVLVLEDVKSAPTRKNPVYRLKKKLVLCLYGLSITEIG